MSSVIDMLLETERLMIRPYKEDDFEEIFTLMQDPGLFRYLDMHVMTRPEHQDLLRWIIRCYEVNCNDDFKYSFNVTLRDTGRHIGWCGLGGAEFNHAQKEIYWLIGTSYQSMGYCTEAVQALLAYGFESLRLPEIIALSRPENAASRRVMEKIGLAYDGIVDGLPEKHGYYNGNVVYKLTHHDYLNQKGDARSCLLQSL